MAMLNPYNYKKPTNVVIKPMPKVPVVKNIPTKNAYDKKSSVYLEQKINSSKPEELVLMLFDGTIKFISQAKLFNDQKNVEKSSNANMRAQAIIQELRSNLDMKIDISLRLESLYLYMNERLVEANMQKNNEILDEVQKLMTELRDAWKTSMKL